MEQVLLVLERLGRRAVQHPVRLPPIELLHRLEWAARVVALAIAVVRKPVDQKGFAVIPRRWAVERIFAWITAHRRLARDYKRNPK